MVGRGAQGRPWFPGQVARYLATGHREAPPPLAVQHEMVAALYESMLLHYGVAIGRRQARKHLGWALDAAADAAGVPASDMRALRTRILTAEEPGTVLLRLREAFDRLAWEGRSAA